jgi:hypothetical protein
MQQPGYPETHSLTLFEVLSVATFGGILLVTASLLVWAVAN